MSKDIHLDTKQGIQIKERRVLLYFHINEPSGSFSSKSLSLSGMDDLFLKRVLFEWLRDR